MPIHSTGAKLVTLLALGALVLLSGCSGFVSAPKPTIQATSTPEVAVAAPNAVNISRPAGDLPVPISRTTPQTVRVDLETVELVGKLADGVTYTYWTFGGQVPGPMVRVRVGDTVEIHLKNSPKSNNIHSVDLHAVTGPGGGAVLLQVKPGEEKVFTFQALAPGVYMYHCGSPHIPTHIAMGMYGMIVVEPEGGLAKVDKEFYVVQGELYTEGDRNTKGNLNYDGTKLFHEDPNYVVFNGAAQALTGDMALRASVGDHIRIFFGDAGPNLDSSFHIIGTIFDRVYPEGALAEPLTNVQTTLVPSGGATMVEFTAKVPGNYTLVDHSITRAIDKGAVAVLTVTGAENKAIYNGTP